MIKCKHNLLCKIKYAPFHKGRICNGENIIWVVQRMHHKIVIGDNNFTKFKNNSLYILGCQNQPTKPGFEYKVLWKHLYIFSCIPPSGKVNFNTQLSPQLWGWCQYKRAEGLGFDHSFGSGQCMCDLEHLVVCYWLAAAWFQN